jgi:hypothetical protein
MLPTLVTFAQYPEIAASLLTYFNDPRFPNAPVTSLVKLEAMTAEGGAGASEHWVRITFQAERDVEWYSNMGILAKLLAQNPTGKFPRKVSSVIRYVEQPIKCFMVALEVGAMEVRVSPSGTGNDIEKVR